MLDLKRKWKLYIVYISNNWNSVVQGAIHNQILNRRLSPKQKIRTQDGNHNSSETVLYMYYICIGLCHLEEGEVDRGVLSSSSIICVSILSPLFVLLIFASEADVFPLVLSSPHPIWLWSSRFFIRTRISQCILQIISIVLIQPVTFL